MSGVRFNNWSDEESCSATVMSHGYECACMRKQGHDGDHVPMVCDAERADGVCLICRYPLDGGTHDPRCVRVQP